MSTFAFDTAAPCAIALPIGLMGLPFWVRKLFGRVPRLRPAAIAAATSP